MTETVYFRADTFRATIYLPRLHELTITNIRKLLGWKSAAMLFKEELQAA